MTIDISRFADEENSRVLISDATLVAEDLTTLRYPTWSVAASRFERCRFDRVKAKFQFGAGMSTSEYVECSFDGAQLSGHNTGRARFVRCSFRGVRMGHMNFHRAEFIDCVFTGMLREINFDADLDAEYQASLGRPNNRYERNDFSGARLRGVAFRGGVDLLDQRLPSEEGYLLIENAEAVLPTVMAEALTWPDTPEKAHILTWLEIQLWYVMRGQRHVFMSPYDWVSRDGSEERAFALLTEQLIKLGARNPGSVR